MKRLSTFVLLAIMLGSLIICPATSALEQKEVFLIRPDKDSPFVVELSELGQTFPAASGKEAFDKTIAMVKEHKKADESRETQIAEIDRQIALLTEQKKALERQASSDLALYALLDKEEATRYWGAIAVLDEDSGIEVAMKTTIVAVAFRAAKQPNLYNLSLIWTWWFNGYFEEE